MNISEFISVAITLFLIIDPLGNIPAFHAILSRIDENERRKVILRELFIALLVFPFFLYIGNSVMAFCGLTESSLNISSTSRRKSSYAFSGNPLNVHWYGLAIIALK